MVLGGSILIPPYATHFDGFRKWATSEGFPESGRIDFLAGSIELDLGPEELFTHNAVKVAIAAWIHRWLEQGDRGQVFMTRARVSSVAAQFSVEPDVVVVLWASLISGRVHFVPFSENPERCYELEGAPDLIVEIVSDSSEVKDTRTLPALYERAGVRELWTVDARGETSIFQISSLEEGSLAPIPAGEDGWTRSPVLGVAVRLVRFRTDLSTWDYTLESRPL